MMSTLTLKRLSISTILCNYFLLSAIVNARTLSSEPSDISYYTSRCENTPSDFSEEDTDFRIVSRAEWAAKPSKLTLEPLKISPVPYVIISHTATKTCSTQAKCQCLLRSMQSYHMNSKNWNDIGYNFIVGGDNLVYVGRGWDSAGAHTFGYNFNSIGITFVGNFNTITPSQEQVLAAQKLIEIGIQENKIAKNYKLLGHRQIRSDTDSPGHILYEIIQKWDHWIAEP